MQITTLEQFLEEWIVVAAAAAAAVVAVAKQLQVVSVTLWNVALPTD